MASIHTVVAEAKAHVHPGVELARALFFEKNKFRLREPIKGV